MYLHSGSFSSSVMAEKRRNLALKELEVEMIDSQFGSFFVNFYQVSDGHAQCQVSWVWFDVIL